MLLNETNVMNQHTEIACFWIRNFLLKELSVLAYFTHKVTLPLLNLVEISSQEELLNIPPKFYHGL